MGNKSFGIFSKTATNTKRQLEVDIVRGLAVLFMMLVHVSGQFLDEAGSQTVFAKVIDFMGCAPAAPVFMFVMGIGLVYSKNQDPSTLFRRGAFIFAAGYILNLLRGFIPLLIGNKLGYYSMSIEGEPWYYYLAQIDILHFAGLAMICISFLKGIKLKEVYFPVLAISAGIASPYVWETGTGNVIPDVFLAAIFGGDTYVFHPLFPWIFYPLMGGFFGWILQRVTNKNKFYLLCTAISVPITTFGLVYYFSTPGLDLGIVTGDIYNYFHHGILGNIIFGSFIIWWLAIWHFAVSFIPSMMKTRLLFWSKSVTVIYFVHWIIIGWSGFLIFDSFNIKDTIIAMVILIFLTDRISDVYLKIKDRITEQEEITPNLS